jgi:NADPH-dependent 2,4-dienoyl-CoA reductase/sulfur reductase-like enzyme/Fe-S-cluster-containing hydrogenase component 2/bacterioferritin-associated ferredoxin
MNEYRIRRHPILNIPVINEIQFSWQSQRMTGQTGETIAAALYANGIHVFGHHPKDGAPQGLFCANGQCAQCLVIADNIPVKACMTVLRNGMRIQPAEGLPVLPVVHNGAVIKDLKEMDIPVLIIGGGPAGLSAAIELGKAGVDVLLVDDKQELGGKMVLQTHRFFGSAGAVYAGTRGIDIAKRLETDVRQYPSVSIWRNSTALAVFSDQKVGILRDGIEYTLVRPQVLLTASGAREKSLAFKGNTLPGVMGAGAFQTLVNRDLVRPGSRLFIVGGGNVGLITGYHAIQAGMTVVGLAEALPECGGYHVHKDKLARLGVPIHTSHTILSANGTGKVESLTIARVDDRFNPVTGTEKSFPCDTVLVAVGLDPVNEFSEKAGEFGMTVYSAGDAEEIAEASAAIFSGKIRGLEIARRLGKSVDEVSEEWRHTAEILKSKPGRRILERFPDDFHGMVPVIHCTQEIPCNPCSSVCPKGLIVIDPDDIRHIPQFTGSLSDCAGCEKCLTTCPGLAITLVDFRKDPDHPLVSIPYEFLEDQIQRGSRITVVDTAGMPLGQVEVTRVAMLKNQNQTRVLKVAAPPQLAYRIAGVRVQEPQISQPLDRFVTRIDDDTMICRCERVTAGEIRGWIRKGYRDLNEIKTVTRAGMGACGSKTCNGLIYRLFRDEGIDLKDVVDSTRRPLFVEVPLGIFAGIQDGGTKHG